MRNWRHFSLLALLALFLISCNSTVAPKSSATATATLGPVPTLATPAAQAYLESAFDFVQQNYVLGKQINWPALKRYVFTYAEGARTPADTYAAIRVLLNSLKPSAHTYFLDPQQAKTAPMLTHQLSGFGFLALTDRLGRAVIITIFPGSPAAQAGIQPGDVIVLANGEPPPRPPFFQGNTLTLQLKHHDQSAPFTATLHAATYSLDGMPDGRRLSDGLGYLDIPQFLESTSDPAALEYAVQGQQIIQGIDATPTCGWIVDLRRNIGGDFYPMLAAAGPILGDGHAGTFIHVNTQIPWAYENGQASEGDQVYVQVPDPYHLQRPNPPVAVLTSGYTGSAAEAALISFLGRPDTRTFGEPTAGAPSAPAGKVLSDGALLAVVAALEADRTGHMYPEQPIAPNQSVTPDWTQIGTDTDPTLQAAEAWLQAQPGCRNN